MGFTKHLIQGFCFVCLLSTSSVFAQKISVPHKLPKEAICTKFNKEEVHVSNPLVNNGSKNLSDKLIARRDSISVFYNLSSTYSVEIISPKRQYKYNDDKFFLANIEPDSTQAFLQVYSNKRAVKLAALGNNNKYKDIVNVSDCQKIEFIFY
jgi:hypothetical protein